MGQKTGRVLVYNAAHTVANNKHKLGLFSGAINFCKNLVINQWLNKHKIKIKLIFFNNRGEPVRKTSTEILVMVLIYIHHEW